MTYVGFLKNASGLLLACSATASCGLFDSGVEWRHGSYALLWVDDPKDVRLSYDIGKGSWLGQVEPRVFAVGADDKYIVAKQHPNGDTSVTNYFIIDTRADRRQDNSVIGPLTADAFAAKSNDLRLPPFTKVLTSLQ